MMETHMERLHHMGGDRERERERPSHPSVPAEPSLPAVPAKASDMSAPSWKFQFSQAPR